MSEASSESLNAFMNHYRFVGFIVEMCLDLKGLPTCVSHSSCILETTSSVLSFMLPRGDFLFMDCLNSINRKMVDRGQDQLNLCVHHAMDPKLRYFKSN